MKCGTNVCVVGAIEYAGMRSVGGRNVRYLADIVWKPFGFLYEAKKGRSVGCYGEESIFGERFGVDGAA